MSADHILAFEVVTADGRFVTASDTVNSDLFWALRGGGGSTFGIVTSVIVRAQPKIKVTKSVFTFSASGAGSENFWKGVNAYFKNFPTFTDAGTWSYFWLSSFGGISSFQMVPFLAPNHTIESFNNLTKPFFDELKALNISVTPNTTFHEDFYSAAKGAFGEDALGMTTIRQGSRLFPKSLWESQAKFDVFSETIKNTVMNGSAVIGFHMAPGNPLKADNAVNPAWRNTQTMLITAATIPENATVAQLKTSADHLTNEVLASWRKAAPLSEGGGVYLNEADIQEPNWQTEFYGANYPRLLSLKRKWDPRDVFYAATAVGSESWEVLDGEQGIQTQNGRLCRI